MQFSKSMKRIIRGLAEQTRQVNDALHLLDEPELVKIPLSKEVEKILGKKTEEDPWTLILDIAGIPEDTAIYCRDWAYGLLGDYINHEMFFEDLIFQLEKEAGIKKGGEEAMKVIRKLNAKCKACGQLLYPTYRETEFLERIYGKKDFRY